MIGRRRHSEPSNPRKAAKAEAKAAEREAAVALRVQLSLSRANEYPVGGGTLLTEPVLVFDGKQRRDLRVFDQDAKQLGVARWCKDKGAKREGYAIYGTDDEVPLVAINWQTPDWLSLSGRREYRVSYSEGVEIASLSARETDHRVRYPKPRPIMVGAVRIGYLKPSPGRKPSYVEDNEGQEVARTLLRTPCDVTEIEPSLAGPLRAIAVVSIIILRNNQPSNWGNGGL